MRVRLFGWFLVLFTLAAVPCAPSGLYREGDVLVRFRSGTTPTMVTSIFAAHGAAASGSPDRAGWWPAHGSLPTSVLVAALLVEPRVESAEPNYLTHAAAVVDAVAHTWTPNDSGLAGQWHLGGMTAAWYPTRGDASVRIAVLDTGLRLGLSDSPSSVLPGYDFVNGDVYPDDDNGHGTFIASVIAGATDNALGLAGVAPDVTLLPIKVLDATGEGTARMLSDGIYHASDAGARVINLSLALAPQVTASKSIHDAVAWAAAHDVVMVAAAGNDGGPAVALPAAFNEVIAVGAVSAAGVRAGYSSYGAALDMVAPGGDAVAGIAAQSFDPATGVERTEVRYGTSVAAAIVSGAAGLIGGDGDDRGEFRSRLELGAVNVSIAGELANGWDLQTGYGRLDPGHSVASADSLPILSESQLSGWITVP